MNEAAAIVIDRTKLSLTAEIRLLDYLEDLNHMSIDAWISELATGIDVVTIAKYRPDSPEKPAQRQNRIEPTRAHPERQNGAHGSREA